MKDLPIVRIKASAVALLLACAGTPLAAQAVSDSTAFIKAVRDADGGRAMLLLGKPGSTVARSRDPATGESALHIAVRRRDAAWTTFMAGRGVDPGLTDKAGDTALGLAARLGFREGVETLIKRGARVDGPNARGETPLIIAVQSGQRDIVQMLVDAGANPDRTDSAAGYSARDYARQDRRRAAILRLLEAAPKAKPAKTGTPAPRQ